jgi:hypothetical protein
MTQKTYILKFYHGSNPKYLWFFRGIRPDGSFYGEIMKFLPQGGGSGFGGVSGKLSDADLVEFHKLVDKIQQTAFKPSDVPWTGILIEGPIGEQNHPIVYQYRQGSQKANGTDLSFEAIIELLKPYMEKFYCNLP